MARNGDVIGHLTGAKVKQAWNNQSWVMYPKGTDFFNGSSAATGPGLTRYTPGVANAYSRVRNLMSFDTYFNSIIGHEMGHVWSREIGRYKYEESFANETAAAVMKAVSVPFEYGSNGGGNMSWYNPDAFISKQR